MWVTWPSPMFAWPHVRKCRRRHYREDKTTLRQHTTNSPKASLKDSRRNRRRLPFLTHESCGRADPVTYTRARDAPAPRPSSAGCRPPAARRPPLRWRRTRCRTRSPHRSRRCYWCKSAPPRAQHSHDHPSLVLVAVMPASNPPLPPSLSLSAHARVGRVRLAVPLGSPGREVGQRPCRGTSRRTRMGLKRQAWPRRAWGICVAPLNMYPLCTQHKRCQHVQKEVLRAVRAPVACGAV